MSGLIIGVIANAAWQSISGSRLWHPSSASVVIGILAALLVVVASMLWRELKKEWKRADSLKAGRDRFESLYKEAESAGGDSRLKSEAQEAELASLRARAAYLGSMLGRLEKGAIRGMISIYTESLKHNEGAKALAEQLMRPINNALYENLIEAGLELGREHVIFKLNGCFLEGSIEEIGRALREVARVHGLEDLVNIPRRDPPRSKAVP